MVNYRLILIYTHWTPEQYVFRAKLHFQGIFFIKK